MYVQIYVTPTHVKWGWGELQCHEREVQLFSHCSDWPWTQLWLQVQAAGLTYWKMSHKTQFTHLI